MFRIDWPAFTFTLTDGSIASQSHHQHFAELSGSGQIAHMTDMQNIEATVCRDHSIARGPQLAGFCGQLLETEDFLVHTAPTTHCNAPGSNSKVAGSFPINSPSTLNHIPGLELIAIFLARRKITASEDKCLPTRICATRMASSVGPRSGISTTSSRP